MLMKQAGHNQIAFKKDSSKKATEIPPSAHPPNQTTLSDYIIAQISKWDNK